MVWQEVDLILFLPFHKSEQNVCLCLRELSEIPTWQVMYSLSIKKGGMGPRNGWEFLFVLIGFSEENDFSYVFDTKNGK